MSTYQQYWPILLAALGALIFAAGAIVVSFLLTRRHPNPAKQEPYECGIPPLSPARVQISVKFYLMA
ncbi:NADH-quinone oxidoreductase subunit A, partial [Candidatus Sumerlaeota bacterium]|nr:NADH-quinone oxidoreductase subunit A [Candidatus Sumerlaeota bacterium]